MEIPILSLFDVVIEALQADHPRVGRVGLMATTGTVRGGLFQRRLAEAGIETVVCDEAAQRRVMEAIYDIKRGRLGEEPESVRRVLVEAAEGLVAGGSEAIVAGCTEIPLALRQEDLIVPYLDVLVLLARAAIRYAGLDPKAR